MGIFCLFVIDIEFNSVVMGSTHCILLLNLSSLSVLPTLPCCGAALSALERIVYSALSGGMFYKCQLGAVAATRS